MAFVHAAEQPTRKSTHCGTAASQPLATIKTTDEKTQTDNLDFSYLFYWIDFVLAIYKIK